MKRATPFHIHFVCVGGIYRSRIAEAYLRSKQIPLLTVTSSGTRASTINKGTVSWYAQRLLYRHNLLPFMSHSWVDVSAKDMTRPDMVVFMGKGEFEHCREEFPTPKQYEVWQLPDFDDCGLIGKPLDDVREIGYIRMSEEVFSLIKEKVDKLIDDLHAAGRL